MRRNSARDRRVNERYNNMVQRILVVDAVAANRIVLKVKLSAAGYIVEQTGTLREARKSIEKRRPDLVIASLPDAQPPSLAALTGFRAGLEQSGLKVLLILPEFNAAARRKAIRAGADDVLRKPVDEEALHGKVRRLLDAQSLILERHIRRLTLATGDLQTSASEPQRNEKARVALVCSDQQRAGYWCKTISEAGLGHPMCLSHARALADAAKVDCFVIEADLDEENEGIRLLDALQRQSRATVMLVLPSADSARAALARKLGADELLFAPVDDAELRDRLDALLHRQRETEALRRSAQEGLRLAMTDTLTELSNRRHATEILPDLLKNSERGISLMMLDLDRFKSINDRFGHSSGDEVLIEFAKTLRAALPRAALLARYGGEEFLAVLSGETESQSLASAEGVRRAVHGIAPLLQMPDLRISTSIGLARHRVDETAERLLARADLALYEAKNNGRDRIEVAHAAGFAGRTDRAPLALLG